MEKVQPVFIFRLCPPILL